MAETILEPDLPVVDPHHHLWDRRNYAAPPSTAAAAPEHPFMTAIADAQRHLLDELLADTGSGHKVVATVFVECGAFYKADGPVELRPVGETEFVNGVAAMSASGMYGDTRACAGIVSRADLLLGDAVGAAGAGGHVRGWRRALPGYPQLGLLQRRQGGPGPAQPGGGGPLPLRQVPRGLPAPGAPGALLRRLAAGAAAARRDQPGPGLPRDAHHPRPRGHADRPREL